MVKMFLRRTCHNLLSTKVNLFRSGVVTNKICPICEQEDETVEHILWSYPSANDVLGSGSISMQKGVSVRGHKFSSSLWRDGGLMW